MSLGYTSVELVKLELGMSPTVDQVRQIEALIAAAEARIGEYTGRWFLLGAIEDEYHDDPATLVQVDYYPIASVEAVSVRYGGATTATDLVADSDWEIANPDKGLIRLFGCRSWPSYGGRSNRIYVSYTPADATSLVSDAGLLVQRAATLLVAGWIRANQSGITADVQSYEIPGDLKVTFASRASAPSVPADVAALLSSLKPSVVIA